jgi:hypothetical protein
MDHRSEIQRHQNSYKPRLQKGFGGGTSTGASILETTKILAGLGVIFIITAASPPTSSFSPLMGIHLMGSTIGLTRRKREGPRRGLVGKGDWA